MSVNTQLVNISINQIDTTKPRIYVACLAAYNDGELHGTWIDAAQDEDDVYTEIKNMLSESPCEDAEEFAIHDYDNFGSVEIHEYETIKTVCEIAQFIDEHGEIGAKLLSYYGDIDNATEALKDRYHGEWESEFDFSSELFDDIYAHDIPENIRFYIDYKKFDRDLFIGDYFSLDADGKTHVFSCY